MKRLMIVVPCYNEEEVFADTAKTLTCVIKKLIEKNKISENSGILFVNDGSRDSTFELIEKEHKENKYVYGVTLNGNVGHQKALLAGIETASKMCDFTISIDADLQDDVEVIEEMVDKYLDGYDMVFGVRNDRKTDGFFKRLTAEKFYSFMTKMGVKTVYNHADFRLMGKEAMAELLRYGEQNIYLRGIVANMGFKTDCVYYARKPRTAGESKYNFKKMLSLAFDGISSFSVKPLSLISSLGITFSALSLIALAAVIVLLCTGTEIGGFIWVLISLWFLAGVILISIGTVGAYVGKIYIETKHRPRYSIGKVLSHDED